MASRTNDTFQSSLRWGHISWALPSPLAIVAQVIGIPTTRTTRIFMSSATIRFNHDSGSAMAT